MNSVIKLYKTKITPAKNCLVERLEDYLSECLLYTRNNFQYIKHAIDINIKLNMNQENYSSFSPNYISIKNDDSDKTYYYFIVGIKWLAVDTLALELNLDTINTFQEIEFSDKTQIIREIQNRSYYTETGEANRDINDYIEGISLPKKVIVNRPFYTGKDYLKWYLMTQSSADLNTQSASGVNPTRTILIPSQQIKVNNAGTTTNSVELRADEFTGGARYIYFTLYDNGSGAGIDNYIYNLGTIVSDYEVRLIKLEITEDSEGLPQFKMESIGYNGNAYNSWTSYHYSITFTKMNFGILSNANLFTATDYFKLVNQFRSPKLYIQAGLNTNLYSMGINDVDRTDSRIVKIVEMPYSPFKINIDNNGVYTIDETYYKYGAFYVDDIGNKDFENKLEEKLDLREYLNVEVPLIDEVDEYNRYVAYNKTRAIKYESKLYSSEFFEVKLTYDSFSYNIELERFVNDIDESPFISLFTIYFKMNRNIKSILGFRWEDEENNSRYESDEDYPFYLICNRNNELTIYNSNYINYLKTGYNFDKKQKEKEIAVGTAGVVAQVVGAVASFASTPFTGGVGVATGIALASSTAVSIGNQIATLSQNEEARKNKRNEIKAQAVNVINADDTDMLSFYGGDKLRLIVREMKSLYKWAVFNLFYYCGYATNRIGKPYYKINPQRLIFEYVQCNPIFENVEGYQSEYIDDLTLRMSAGITIFHAYKVSPSSTSYSWNFEQNRANLDAYLIN